MNHNYPEHILKKLRMWDELDEDDTSKDEEWQTLSPETAFERVLEFEGIFGYDYSILRWIDSIFKVRLIPSPNEQTREDFIQGMVTILSIQDVNEDAAYQMADVLFDAILLEQ